MTRRYRLTVSRSFVRGLWLLSAVVLARSAGAQTPPSPEAPDQSLQAAPTSSFRAESELSESWIPLGSAPVDQAGAGRRGYVLPGEDSGVAAAGSNRFSIHAVAANNFYHEENAEFLVNQRYETHTVALDYRRGFKVRSFPRFEIGGHIQLHQSDNGVLNGLILGVESFWASLTGYRKSKNELRVQGATPLPLGTLIERNGSPIYRQEGGGSGFGDGSLIAKLAVLDGEPSSKAPSVSARFGVNLAGSSPFTEGNYIGAGISVDKKLSQGMAFHGDVRVTRTLDHVSTWNLPLRSWTYGFSAGPEFRLPKRSSLNLQIDGSSTPYRPTGTLAFDRGYGALTFGLGHRFGRATAQFYVRENMDLPFRVRWNTDPDLSVGLRVRVN